MIFGFLPIDIRFASVSDEYNITVPQAQYHFCVSKNITPSGARYITISLQVKSFMISFVGVIIMLDSILRCKSKDFAKQIVFLCRDVKSKYKESVLTNQLLRSGTRSGLIFMRHNMPKAKKTLSQNWK